MMNKVAAFYQFLALPDADAVRTEFSAACEARGLRGTILVSPEGINGTLAGQDEQIMAFVASLRTAMPHRPAFERLELKFSAAGDEHFDRLRIRLKPEIITFGATLAADATVGTRVPAQEWNALISNPDVLLIDTRNAFEVDYGTFEGAVNPGLTSFSEFRTYVDEQLAGRTGQKIALFCTGGIRCEKASAYMIEAGFKDVYQLEGGILRYLEDVAEERSLWRGNCFVFDRREALGHGLALQPTSDIHLKILDTTRENGAE